MERVAKLRYRLSGYLSPSRRLYRARPEGRQAGGPAGRSVNQIRASDQSDDGPYSWPRSSAVAARPRRRGDRMSTRREAITLLGGAAAAWPLAARAEQAGKVYRIGFLANDPTIPTTAAGAAFRDGLSK